MGSIKVNAIYLIWKFGVYYWFVRGDLALAIALGVEGVCAAMACAKCAGQFEAQFF